MYSRGYPPQNPRFSPNRQGGNYNNNNRSPANCGYQQWQNQNQYRTPSPNGPRNQRFSPSPQFQIPFSPMSSDSPFVAPGMRSPYHYGGNGSFSHGQAGGTSPRGAGGAGGYGGQFTRSPRHFSPYTSSPRGRGNFSQGKASTPNFRGRARGAFSHKKELNPGGCVEISRYYNSTMIEDPWRQLRPAPFTHKPAATT